MGFTVGDTVYIANTQYTVEMVSKGKNDTHPVKLRCNVNGCTQYVMIDGRLDEYDEIPSVTFKPQSFPDLGKPEWQPKPGELCWVWDENFKTPVVGTYVNKGEFLHGDGFKNYWQHRAPFNNGQLPEQFAHLLEGGQK